MHLDTQFSSGYHGSMPDTNKWMSIKAACEHLQISRSALYKAIEDGKIKKDIQNDKPVVKKSDVLKYSPREYKRGIAGPLSQALYDRILMHVPDLAPPSSSDEGENKRTTLYWRHFRGTQYVVAVDYGSDTSVFRVSKKEEAATTNPSDEGVFVWREGEPFPDEARVFLRPFIKAKA